jgi:anti-sigma factor RsiW
MKSNEHVLDDILEAYALGRLQEDETDRVEDHMLVCEGCRLRLVEMESFVKATRMAAMRIREREDFFEQRLKPWWHRVLQPMLARPVWAVAAVALLGIVFLLPMNRRNTAFEQEILLSATRGSEEGQSVAAKTTTLRLRLDLRDLPPVAQYQVTIVDHLGRPVWDWKAPRVDSPHELRMQVSRQFKSGTYWVRLLDAASLKLLREYPLRVS